MLTVRPSIVATSGAATLIVSVFVTVATPQGEPSNMMASPDRSSVGLWPEPIVPVTVAVPLSKVHEVAVVARATPGTEMSPSTMGTRSKRRTEGPS